MNLTLRDDLAWRYESRSQIARVLTQEWVGREVPCLSCSAAPLTPTAQNTKARDFECPECSEPYELKASSRRFGRLVPDGEYSTFRSVVGSDRVPNLLLMEYSRDDLGVRTLLAVHRSLISDQAIVPRKPLSSKARRAGWQGCSINMEAIPASGRVSVVRDGRALPWPIVTKEWARFEFMVRLRPESRGWLRDVLSFVQELAPGPFRLEEVYRFEDELASLHPANRNIRPKIRQQLQILVAEGAILRRSPGCYELFPSGPAAARPVEALSSGPAR